MKKIELFESKLKQLQNELSIEQNKLSTKYAEKRVNDEKKTVYDERTINEKTDITDGVLKEDRTNLVRHNRHQEINNHYLKLFH